MIDNNLYDYLGKNEGNLYITIFILIISFSLIGYFNVRFYLKSLQKNWSSIRCNPIYMPFSSIINPNPNLSSFENVSSNFSFCSNTILSTMVQDFMEPIYYIYNVINKSIGGVVNDIQKVRQRIFTIIDNIENIDKSLMSKIFSTTIPLQHNLVKMKDTMKKTQAIGTTGIMSMIGSYFGIISFIRAFVNIAIEGLLILTGIIVPLIIFIFTIPLAAPLLVIFGIVSGFLAVIIIGLQGVVHKSIKDIPKKPHCFDENTLLELNNGTYKKIKDIEIGDILLHDGKINGYFKVISENEEMYNYKGIIVSGSHNVYENGRWINVCESGYSTYLKNYKREIIYCLNTENGTVTINNVIFSDWNDIDGPEYYKLQNIINRNSKNNIYINLLNINNNKERYNEYNKKIFEKSFNLHRDLEYGFIGITELELLDGNSKNIKNIEINDVLKNGEKVIGLVEIDAQIPETYYYPKLDIFGTQNICLEDEDLGSLNLLNYIERIKINIKPYKLYNILTNTGTFYINGNKYNDYNGGLEKLLSV